MAKRQETLWELDEHSLGKHLVLKSYINAWFPILSKYNGRLLFIDGFAGPGEYKNGYIGSPLIALDAALYHRHEAVREQEIIFFFIENDRKRLDCVFQTKVATDSRRSLPPIPRESCH